MYYINAEGQSALVIVRRPPSVCRNKYRLWYVDGMHRVEQGGRTHARTHTHSHTNTLGVSFVLLPSICCHTVFLLTVNWCCCLSDANRPRSARGSAHRYCNITLSRQQTHSSPDCTRSRVHFDRCIDVRPDSFKDLVDFPLQHG